MTTRRKDQNPIASLPSGSVDHLEVSRQPYHAAFELITAVNELFTHADQPLTPTLIMKEMSQLILKMGGFSATGFYVADETDGSLSVGHIYPVDKLSTFEKYFSELTDANILDKALASKTAVIYTAKNRHKLLVHTISTSSDLRGCFIGDLSDAVNSPDHFTLQLISTVMTQCAHVIDTTSTHRFIHHRNQQLINILNSREKEIKYQYTHDSLTNLPNRSQFIQDLKRELQRAKRSKLHVAVIQIDLDYFKRINEAFGRTVGDETLRQVALRLDKNLRDNDSMTRLSNEGLTAVSHFGGDEFCLLITDMLTPDHVLNVVNRLHSIMEAPFIIGTQKIIQTFSAGISSYPEHSDNAEELMRLADIALYQAKSQNKNSHLLYASSMQDASVHYMDLVNRMHDALKKEQFQLYYQPQINSHTGEVVGLEALIRWIDDEGKFIPPDHFIPFAEETGLIIPIGTWVIEEACRQVGRLASLGYNIPISVNISSHQFAHADFLGTLIGILESSNTPAELLKLELTEHVIMKDVQQTIHTLNALHDYGFKISIDDFGTGYSSLSYLKRFPIDDLKIDRIFVSDIIASTDDAAIAGAIIALATSLNMVTVAEGVEMEDQVHFLSKLGCKIIQGYFYSKPLPHAALLAYLADKQASHVKTTI